MKRQFEKIIQNVRGRLEPRARLGGLGKYDVAEKLLLQTRDIQSRLLGPDSPRTADTTYNLACLAVRRGRRDEAFSFLRGAIQHGLSPAQAVGMETDPDLKSLHGDTRFETIIAEASSTPRQRKKQTER
ncbi:MAG TPA: tetratricopeptide repeat protein [Terriglobales bacterium]|nr:tetratricopeptide repeat protein [Terriglobales bacterium]